MTSMRALPGLRYSAEYGFLFMDTRLMEEVGKLSRSASTPSTTTETPSVPCAAGERKSERRGKIFLPCAGRSSKSLLSNLTASALFSGGRGLSILAVIVTASLIVVFIVTLMAGGAAAPTVIANSTASKFFASALREYSPGGTLLKLRRPMLSALVSRVSPVALFVRMRFAPGITACIGSSTTPLRVALSCAITLIIFHDFLLRVSLKVALSCAITPPHKRMTTVNADMQKYSLLILAPPSKTKSQDLRYKPQRNEGSAQI